MQNNKVLMNSGSQMTLIKQPTYAPVLRSKEVIKPIY